MTARTAHKPATVTKLQKRLERKVRVAMTAAKSGRSSQAA